MGMGPLLKYLLSVSHYLSGIFARQQVGLWRLFTGPPVRNSRWSNSDAICRGAWVRCWCCGRLLHRHV